ncbi:MAG TPA: DUF2087 domain-containing protein [Actinomycetota bacterium]|nr:DUF2087 domain-containing protein [Actinomycetota bacterium]
MSPSATPEEILRALADPERLAVAGALAHEPMTAKALADGLDLTIQKVRRHITRLTGTGLVQAEADRRTYRLVSEALREAAREIGPSRDTGMALGAVDDEEEAVLRHYFRGGRLREIPAKQAKRRMVLTRLALEFEAGVRYPERLINETLKRFHDDYAALRRYLVDEGFLTREKGLYWRSGGPVEV